MTQQEQTWNGEERRKSQDVVTVNACLLQSQQKANEAMAQMRSEIAQVQKGEEAKLDHITELVETMAKAVDQLVFKVETPQIGIADRMAAFEKFQKETVSTLQAIQQVLTGEVNARHKMDKIFDWVLGGTVTYILVRLLPYIGTLLQK